MSSFSRCLGIAYLLVLAGCGFEPLYVDESGRVVSEEIAHIRVAGIEERIGQKVHNLLLDRLNPRGRPAAPRYTLSVRTGLSTSELGLQINEVATRAKLSLNASFVLTDDRSGRVLLKGNVRSINSYNIPNSQYAKVTAEADSANRAAREISNQIKSRLEIYFSRKGS